MIYIDIYSIPGTRYLTLRIHFCNSLLQECITLTRPTTPVLAVPFIAYLPKAARRLPTRHNQRAEWLPIDTYWMSSVLSGVCLLAIFHKATFLSHLRHFCVLCAHFLVHWNMTTEISPCYKDVLAALTLDDVEGLARRVLGRTSLNRRDGDAEWYMDEWIAEICLQKNISISSAELLCFHKSNEESNIL